MPVGEGQVPTRQERVFFAALGDLYRKAGNPSSRAIAAQIGGISHTTVNLALKGPKLPTWPVVVKLVEALNGDVEPIRQLWSDAQGPSDVYLPRAESEIQVFVSYARIDDKATYGRISKLVDSIADSYESLTGRTVGVFKDVDSIKPGDDWRDRIRLGLSYSSIFLAFVSPAYLRSPSCREELSEFLAFLTSSSAERLVIPLIFANRNRIERDFEDDDLWARIARREYQDISRLRTVDPGSTEWIDATERLAELIDDTLFSYKKADRQRSDIVVSAAIFPATEASDTTLERMAELESEVPLVTRDTFRIAELMNEFNEAMTAATAPMAHAQTFTDKLRISKKLAKQLDPTAEELSITADRLVENFSKWDFFIQYLGDYARDGGDLTDPSARAVLVPLWELSTVGSASLGGIKEFANTINQGLGVSRDLDRPFMVIQAASLRIADLSGMLDGWKEALETLESEYLSKGFLDAAAADPGTGD